MVKTLPRRDENEVPLGLLVCGGLCEWVGERGWDGVGVVVNWAEASGVLVVVVVVMVRRDDLRCGFECLVVGEWEWVCDLRRFGLWVGWVFLNIVGGVVGWLLGDDFVVGIVDWGVNLFNTVLAGMDTNKWLLFRA